MRVASIVLLVAAACATGRGGSDGGATFRVFYPDQPAAGFRAKIGKKFYVKPVAKCTYDNGRDARWSMTGARVAGGELPEGFVIVEGAISGTTMTAGTWKLEVEFSGVVCAGKREDEVLVPVVIMVK